MKINRLICVTGMVVMAVFTGVSQAKLDPATEQALQQAINSPDRSAGDKARDKYRKPMQVLDFLGFKSTMTVVEIWPAGGWYTQILAPALNQHGQYYGAQFDMNGPYAYQRRSMGKFLTLLGSHPKQYSHAKITTLAFPYHLRIAPAGSADMVLTFRNTHNWVMKGYGGGEYNQLVYDAMYDALKPGGILGIVDHKWNDPKNEDPYASNGYISPQRVIGYAQKAGFKLIGQSDILANPKDDKQHPKGVWTLPPTLAMGDKDKQKYLHIGESDRFILKFQKPEK